MPTLSQPILSLPNDIAPVLSPHPVVVFDGECVLCSGFFKFLIKYDKSKKFRFVIDQSPLGIQIYRALGLPTDNVETNLVCSNGQVLMKADAFSAAMGELGWPWRVFLAIHWAPKWLKNPLYDLIARNRYRIFGRYDVCMVPDADLRARFLPGGWDQEIL